MIDERFSQALFKSLKLDSPETDELAQELAEEIQNKMHEVIYPAFLRIVEKLNDMGHNLKPYYEAKPGDIAYRDDSDKNGYGCKLRVGIDTVISSGYAHLSE